MVGKGRRKVEIKLIEDSSSRLICFSKRRKGLFKKAAELSILSGAKIAVLAFSRAGKLYCSDTKIMDSLLLCPQQLDNSSEIRTEDGCNSSFAVASSAETLPCLHSENPSQHVSDSSSAGATAEQPFSSDVPTANSLLCPQLNISTVNDAGDIYDWDYALPEAMDANLCCYNSATLNPPLEIYSEPTIGGENCGEFDFAAAMAADSLLWPQFEMPLQNNIYDSSFAGAMVEEPFFSDVPTPDSLLCPQPNISTVNDAGDIYDSSFAGPMAEMPLQDNCWNYAVPEAMDGNLYYSDAASLNPLLRPQFDISAVQEEDGCWESDFAEAMAGKEVPFWFNRTNVGAMGFEELRRLERAIGDYGQLQFAKNCYG